MRLLHRAMGFVVACFFEPEKRLWEKTVSRNLNIYFRPIKQNNFYLVVDRNWSEYIFFQISCCINSNCRIATTAAVPTCCKLANRGWYSIRIFEPAIRIQEDKFWDLCDRFFNLGAMNIETYGIHHQTELRNSIVPSKKNSSCRIVAAAASPTCCQLANRG